MERTDLDALWHRFKSNGDRSARDEIICHYLPLVEKIVSRITPWLPKHVDVEDLMAHGIVGLISAVDRYDPNSGTRFETFAYMRVRGEVLDFLRREDVLPKAQRRKIKQLYEKFQELNLLPGTGESEEKVASALGISADEVRELMRLSHLSAYVYLSDSVKDDITISDTVASGQDIAEEVDRRLIVERITEMLSAFDYKTQKALELYFIEGLRMKEVGEVLELSESRVSQMISSALFVIRQRLEKEGVS